MSAKYNINITKSKFDGNSSVVREYNGNNVEGDEAILAELKKIHGILAEEDPLIADAVDALREAVEKKDEKTIGKKIALLTSGVAKSVIASLASAKLKTFLGLS